MDKVVVIGGGGHAKVIIDILLKNGYDFSDIDVLDDNLPLKSKILNVEVKGKVIDCLNYQKNTKFIIAIGNNKIREKISKEYDINYETFIHPSAQIATGVKIGKGSVIMAGCIVNPNTIVGNHVIVNTSVSVDHDSVIDDYAHLSPGVHMGGSVKVGKRSWIGVGSSVKNNITIGDDITIGVGSVVIKDVLEEGIYVGCPIKKLNKHLE